MSLNHTRRMRFRWNSAVMLASRTLNPVFLLVIPLVICCYMIFMNWPMFSIGLLLAFLWAIHGLVNAVATISVFRPYRHVVKSSFCKMIYKEKYISRNSFQRTFRSTTEAPIKVNQIGTISNAMSTIQNESQ
ncbi:unnamed protein product [Bursaphelenchus xylophilus]|uniref:(pine wood nematode) hypothetical protein n=1 Tax=Bursaphelenchus xylophilus TaxID=6326 RepID=A0A1I7S4B4_BURXY|nr:unnamed protein product [Bursaphelenchus xylophilus]CAG9116917.1 unnamed protein product [Bursaphelenchus xylophilus]